MVIYVVKGKIFLYFVDFEFVNLFLILENSFSNKKLGVFKYLMVLVNDICYVCDCGGI